MNADTLRGVEVLVDPLLVCTVCGNAYIGNTDRYVCTFCGGSIEPTIDLLANKEQLINILRSGSKVGIWDYAPFFALENHPQPVTLGEGNTPLLHATNIGSVYGLDNLYLKNETINPTSTYKDRFATIDISLKKNKGATSVALGSAGNAGSSIAAYAAVAGIDCYVILPSGPIRERAMQASSYGAKFIQSEGQIDDFLNVIETGVQEFGWANSSTTMLHNPCSAEGYKTIAYEIARSMDFKTPDYIVCPVGGGILISKVWRGFTEMLELGVIDRLPKMIAVQAAGCAPVVKAMEEGATFTSYWENPDTLAGSINDPETFEGVTVLDTVRKSGGRAIAVDDEEIVEAMKLCAKREAVLAEPASASVLAAVKNLREEGFLKKNDTVVCVVSGSALRDLPLLTKDHKTPPLIRPRNLEDTAKAIEYYKNVD